MSWLGWLGVGFFLVLAGFALGVRWATWHYQRRLRQVADVNAWVMDTYGPGRDG